MAEDGAQKVYTRGGDGGETSLIGGSRVSKGHLRLEAYGTIDELNSIIGLLEVEVAADLNAALSDEALNYAGGEALCKQLREIQSDLFNLGSQLACEDANVRAKLPTISEEKIKRLETSMDDFSATLKPLKNFVLPGGSRSACQAHLARTVCRRAERICVQIQDLQPVLLRFINRLSDFFFVLARHLNHLLKIDEPIWSAKQA